MKEWMSVSEALRPIRTLHLQPLQTVRMSFYIVFVLLFPIVSSNTAKILAVDRRQLPWQLDLDLSRLDWIVDYLKVRSDHA